MLLLLRRRRDDVVFPSEMMKRGINSDMVKKCGRIRQRDAPSHFRLQSFLGHHLTKMTNIARIGILERKCDFTSEASPLSFQQST